MCVGQEGAVEAQVQRSGSEELSWTHSCRSPLSVVEASYQESARGGKPDA